jgi:hypothetical protein
MAAAEQRQQVSPTQRCRITPATPTHIFFEVATGDRFGGASQSVARQRGRIVRPPLCTFKALAYAQPAANTPVTALQGTAER